MQSSSGQQAARYVLSIVLLVLGAWVLRNFLPALCWAVVLALATSTLYRRWHARFKGKRRDLWAALTFTSFVGIVLIVPLAYGGFVAVREAIALLRSLGEPSGAVPQLPPWLLQLPLVGSWARRGWSDWFSHMTSASAGFAQMKPAALEWTRALGLQILHRISTLAFTLLTLFFVYMYRDSLRSSVHRVCERTFGSTVTPVLDQVGDAIRATVDGIVLVAVAEGFLMGAVYAIAGAPHPVLFGALTAAAAIIPFAAPLAFGIVAVVLVSQGAIGAAVGVMVAGLIVLFIADHFVRPIIIGEGARLPFLWVLLGILGGVETFGLVGIFLGPALMAALMALWRESSGTTAARPRPQH